MMEGMNGGLEIWWKGWLEDSKYDGRDDWMIGGMMKGMNEGFKVWWKE